MQINDMHRCLNSQQDISTSLSYGVYIHKKIYSIFMILCKQQYNISSIL